MVSFFFFLANSVIGHIPPKKSNYNLQNLTFYPQVLSQEIFHLESFKEIIHHCQSSNEMLLWTLYFGFFIFAKTLIYN